MTPAKFTIAPQLRGRRDRAPVVPGLRPTPGHGSLARCEPTWAPWWRLAGGTQTPMTRPEGFLGIWLEGLRARWTRTGHAKSGPRSRGGTLRVCGSVPAPGAQPAGFAMRTVFRDAANPRICPGWSPGERSQRARLAEPFLSRRQHRTRRRASSMSAARDSSSALTPVPWGDRPRGRSAPRPRSRRAAFELGERHQPVEREPSS